MDWTIETAGRALADPAAYTDEDRLHPLLGLLRREAPVHWVEAPLYEPFWAITRHRGVTEIEREHDRFLNAPRTSLMPAAVEREMAKNQSDFRTIVQLDGPEHRVMRAIAADWFSPRTVRVLHDRVSALAKQYVDHMFELGPECDFVTDVAKPFSLHVILALLGMPESDFPTLGKLTDEFFGNSDAEQARGAGPEDMIAVQRDLFAFFQRVKADRRSTPTEDLASAIANARIAGELLSDLDAASYYVIIATAGHHTIGNTMSGGLRALIEHPDQLRRLQQDLRLMPLAVDELVRWVTPTKTFMRTATEDYELYGVTIRAGDAVLLSYLSANRDEEVFTDPFRFDVGRDPNRHLAFGHGVHYCLGAALARVELGALFAELLPRVRTVELAGRPASSATTFAGGLKRLPIRYEAVPTAGSARVR
jgi:cytochrome P450